MTNFFQNLPIPAELKLALNSEVGGIDSSVPARTIRQITGNDTILPSDDILVVIDSGSPIVLTFSQDIEVLQEFQVIRVAFGPDSGESCSFTGASSFFFPISQISGTAVANLTKIGSTPTHTFAVLSAGATPTFVDSGRWTPSLVTSITANDEGYWGHSRIGQTSSAPASAVGDLVTLRGAINFTLLTTELLSIDITDLPVSIANNESLILTLNTSYYTGTDDFYFTVSRQDDGATIRLTANTTSSGGSSGLITFGISYEAGA